MTPTEKYPLGNPIIRDHNTFKIQCYITLDVNQGKVGINL